MNGIVKSAGLGSVACMCLTLVVLLGCEAPAEFEVQSLTVTPSETSAGEEVTVTAEVWNSGGTQGTYDAILTVDGSEVAVVPVALAGDASKAVTFNLLRDAPGSYQVGVGEMKSSLVVTEEEKAKDTDGDGLPDSLEQEIGTNPCEMDTDGDGLTDSLEQEIGTNPCEVDTDGDGLPDGLEQGIGASPCEMDTDGDGLPDYEEYCKYMTDPAKADSDGDGIPDNDWDERREYCRTVKAKCSIEYPYDLETMNDLFQDVRKIEETEDKLTYEVILYSDTRPLVVPRKYPRDDLPPEFAHYTNSTTLFNYSYEMQQEIEDIVCKCRTDREVAGAIIAWVQQNTSKPIDNPGPFLFRYGVKDGELVRENNGWIADEVKSWPKNKLLDTFVFGESMFRNRTHGTCGSAATLVCTMLRAAGIPARIGVSTPIYPSEEYDFVNHWWNEIYIGDKWIRADAFRGCNVPMTSPYAFVKVMSFEDYEHVNFATTWGTKYCHPSKHEDRPYVTYGCEEQNPIHRQPYVGLVMSTKGPAVKTSLSIS